jgi:plastocyanin
MNGIARIALLGTGILIAASAGAGCSSDNGNTGGGGSGGSTGVGGSTGQAGAAPGGSTGQAGSGPGGAGGSIPFEAVEPCTYDVDYMTGTTVTFPASGGFSYSPKCLKVARGATVTFMSPSSSFTAHPLKKSTERGTLTNNPIVDTSTGSSTTVTFPNPGFYAYYCAYHGSDSDGANMTGVVWVQ